MTTRSFALDLTTDPAAFLTGAGEHLAADPVLTTVVSSVTTRAVADDERGAPRPDHPRWWATVRDGSGAVVGVGMRTAPFAPQPVYLLPMPDEAAVALARLLHARGEAVGGVNGALSSATAFAEETARLTGGTVDVHEQLRLWELGDPVPHGATGHLRRATRADARLAAAWWNDFEALSAEMAGRAPVSGAGEGITEDELTRRAEAGLVWLWEDGGTVVHLTHANPPAHGVARIGPVITPHEHRRRGYASAAVAGVSAHLREAGHRVCLFTDQANPTSNRIYAAIGFEPVVDMVSLVVRGADLTR